MELERDQFEEVALAHFVAQRAAGVQISGDNGCEPTRESLFWRDDKGDYGVRMFNAAWWGWKEASVATRKTCEVPTLDEAIRQAHWAHWAAEEHHVVAVSVRHLRLLANRNDTAAPQAAAQPPAPGEAAREYMTGYSDCKEWAQPSQAVELSDEEQVVLLRFNETCEDGQGYDVKTSMMSRLAEIVVVSRKFGSVYFVTEYGQRVIAEVGGE